MDGKSDDTTETLRHTLKDLVAKEQYRKVLELCEAIQLNDDLPPGFWYCKAMALDAMGEKSLALDALRSEIASLKRVPPVILTKIGRLLTELGSYAEAVICLRESCEISPSSDRLVMLGCALVRLGQGEQARRVLQKAVEMEPGNDEAWNNLGAYSLDSPSEAVRAFNRALELNPDRADSYSGLASVYISEGRVQEAIEAARKGLENNRLSGLCHILVADGMESLGHLKEAEKAYSMAFRCDGVKPRALLGMARILERQARHDEALDWYLRGLRAWPDDIDIRTAYLEFVDVHDCSDPAIGETCRRCALPPGAERTEEDRLEWDDSEC